MGNKGNNRRLPLWAICLLIFVFLLSLVAVILAVVAIKAVPEEGIDLKVFDKIVAVIGLILALVAASATVFTIGTSIDINKYRLEIAAIHNDLGSQLHETNFALSSLESIAEKKAIYIQLARGRLLCKSAYSDEDDLQEGINLIQSYYMKIKGSSSVYEDVAVLERISKNRDLKKEVRDLARNAIGIIKKNKKTTNSSNSGKA